MAPSYILSKDGKRQIAVASDSEARDRARGGLLIMSAPKSGVVVENPADAVAWVRAERAVPTVVAPLDMEPLFGPYRGSAGERRQLGKPDYFALACDIALAGQGRRAAA